MRWLHRDVPTVVGGLTREKRAQKIAEVTGESPSKIKARLDKEADAKARALGKATLANRNPVGTVEYALRYAVQRLGAKRVADILGVGESTIYKAANPNEPGRKFPDLSWRRVLDLVRVLKREGHTEFFSTAIAAEEDGLTAVDHLPTVHHALSAASLAHGEVARLLVLATDADGDGGETITPAEAALIAEAVENSRDALDRLLSQVLAESATGAKQ